MPGLDNFLKTKLSINFPDQEIKAQNQRGLKKHKSKNGRLVEESLGPALHDLVLPDLNIFAMDLLHVFFFIKFPLHCTVEVSKISTTGSH